MPAAPGGPSAAGRQERAALEQLGRQAALQQTQDARQTAGDLVASLFFAPLLEEMRKLPFGRKFSHGGRGEDAFAQQLDTRLAHTIASADQRGLVDQVAGWIERTGGAGRAQELRTAAPAWPAALAAQAQTANLTREPQP